MAARNIRRYDPGVCQLERHQSRNISICLDDPLIRFDFRKEVNIGMLRWLLFGLSVLVSALAADEAQSADAQQSTTAGIKFFESRIRPLLARHCFACHSSRSKSLEGGLRLDNRRGISAGGDSGAVLIAGKPDASPLIEAVRYTNPDLQMPPKVRLPDRDIADLVKWVRLGAPIPTNYGAKQAKAIDFASAKSFWSFRSFETANPPLSDERAISRIDAFVHARLELHGLSPSQTADHRTLIRRATFDLTGLPPTSQQVMSFERDNSPVAYERLIDRLLASPRHGERWGRHWLDLARYSDSTASWLKRTGQAYVYRDWVVAALNEDLPYDEFVKRQLGTDMLANTEPADIAALGFIGLSPTYWKELKLDHKVIEVIVHDEYEERIDTVSRTFLGLTVACARCHDHKFDPITTEDYYALAGVFASTRLSDHPIIESQMADVVRQARKSVQLLATQIKQLGKKKPISADARKKIANLRSRIDQIKKSTPLFDSPLAHAVDDASLFVVADGPNRTKLVYKPNEARDLPVAIRGNPAQPGTVIARRFLTVLSKGSPSPFQHGSGRLDLAKAIVGAGAPLAARVIVNRVWAHHFGHGLVRTTSNFGSQGDRPSHPKLLDDLAARFIKSGWSMKWLHREIMTSRTYQQASLDNATMREIDPDNRWLWRMSRRRLDIEAWRDAMLAVAGTLDERLGGPPIKLSDLGNLRRSIYGRVERRELYDLLKLYDFPDPTSHSPKRETTITPLQQLFVLNSPFLEARSNEFAKRLELASTSTEDDRVARTYLFMFGRTPTAREQQFANDFLTTQNDELWRQYIHALLGTNEFLFVD